MPPRSNDEVEFHGSLDDYWSYTKVRDWILLHPEIGRTALHLYVLLRSMLSEKRTTSLRRMSVDQLCWLLPGINGKPIGKRTVEEALRELDRLGLVTNPDHERLVTSTGKNGITNTLRRYQVNDLPSEPYTGWRNAWDKLDAYHPGWRTDPPQAPTHGTFRSVEARKTADRKARSGSDRIEPQISAQLRQKTAPTTQKAAAAARRNSADKPSTRAVATPEEDLLRSSPSPWDGSDPTAVEGAGALVAAAWSQGLSTAGHPPMPRRQRAIQTQAAELVAAGHDVMRLCAAAQWMGTQKPGWNRLEDVLTLEEFATQRPARPATPAKRCGQCDDGWLYKDPENALGPYRCPDCRPASAA
jgi:hypothetical protein